MISNKKNNSQIIYILIAFTCFFIIVFLLASFSPSKFFSGDTREGISLVRDDQELDTYYQRISYYRNNDLPYQHERIEYPPLAVFYLTVPEIFSENFNGYKQALMVQNIILALFLILLTYLLAKNLNTNKKLLWLFVLPSFVYYILNRFDIWPAFLIQLAVFLLFKKKFIWSFFILSLAFLAKGYAIIFFPIFLIYCLNQKKQQAINLFKNRYLYIIVLPFVTITALICTWAGIENGLFPYIFQSTRNFAYGSFYLIYIKSLMTILPAGLMSAGMFVAAKVLFLLQIILPLMLYAGYQFFRKLINNNQEVIHWLILTVMLYMMFSVYYSPQWLVWLLPLLVLARIGWREILLIIGYDIFNYFTYPVVWNYASPDSSLFGITVLVRTILFVLIILLISRKIINTRKQQKLLKPSV